MARTIDGPAGQLHVNDGGGGPGVPALFVHSYAGIPSGPDADAAVLARTTHGASFVSAVARDNVLGVQFHPERSGSDGLRLLANVVAMARAGDLAAAPAISAASPVPA